MANNSSKNSYLVLASRRLSFKVEALKQKIEESQRSKTEKRGKGVWYYFTAWLKGSERD